MAVSSSLAVFCLGFLCIIGNVWANDLDLGNLMRSGFPTERSLKNSCTYTQVTPDANHVLSRVLNGGQTVWEAPQGSKCIGLMFVESQNGQQPIMYIESLKGRDYTIQYYAKNGQNYVEITNKDYNYKLSQLAIFPVLDPNAGAAEQPEGVSNQDDENDDSGFHAGEPGFAEVLTAYEGTESIVQQNKPSLRKELYYPCNSDQTDCSHKRRILDILRATENKRVVIDYEINDGVFVMIVTIKRGKKVTFLYEGDNLIWNGGDSKMIVLSCHAFFGEYRLAELYYQSGGEFYYKFFAKKIDSWLEIRENDFLDYYKSMKANIKIVKELTLNIGNVSNSDKLFEKTEENERFKAFTYFPLPSYRINQVKDGSIEIWGSSDMRCNCATVVKEGNKIRFLKLEILSKNDEDIEKFYQKVDGKYDSLTGDVFEALINEPDYERQGVMKAGTAGTETPTDFDITDYNPIYISEGQYIGVNFKSFVPPPGKFFREVKLAGTLIWKAGPNEYTEFVRVFYPKGEPKLGFIKLVKQHKEEDEYFVKNKDGWTFVPMQIFRDTFYMYANSEGKPAESKVEPKVETKVEEPKAEEPKIEPKAETKVEEPKAEELKIEPKIEEPKPEPKIEEPKIEPKVKETKPEKSKPEPKPEKSKAEPKPEKSKPEPKPEKPKVEPKDNQPKGKQTPSKPLKTTPRNTFKSSYDRNQWMFDINRRQYVHDHLMPDH